MMISDSHSYPNSIALRTKIMCNELHTNKSYDAYMRDSDAALIHEYDMYLKELALKEWSENNEYNLI